MEQTHPEKTLRTFFIVLGILLILSIAFFLFVSSRQQSALSFTYHGFDFKKDQYGYQIKLFVNQATYPVLMKIRNRPQDLETIPTDPIDFLAEKKQIYVAIDPEENLTGKTTIAALEINAFLDNEFLYDIPVNSSFTKPYNGGLVRTCADVNANDSVIILTLANETRISAQDDCVYIYGKTEEDLIRAADRLVLTLLGVME